MICPECYKKNEKAGKFCGFCGAPMVPDSPTVDAGGEPSSQLAGLSSQQKRIRLLYIVSPLPILLIGYVIYAALANSAYKDVRDLEIRDQRYDVILESHLIAEYEDVAKSYPITSAKSKAEDRIDNIKLESARLSREAAKKAEQRQIEARKRAEQQQLEDMRRAEASLYEVYDTYRDTKDPFLNLRSQPSPQARIVKKMNDGTKVEVLEKNLGPKKKWWKVKISGSSTSGYAHSRYLRKV